MAHDEEYATSSRVPIVSYSNSEAVNHHGEATVIRGDGKLIILIDDEDWYMRHSDVKHVMITKRETENGKLDDITKEIDRIVADDGGSVQDQIRNITDVFKRDQVFDDGNYCNPEKQTASLYRQEPFTGVELDALLNQSRQERGEIGRFINGKLERVEVDGDEEAEA